MISRRRALLQVGVLLVLSGGASLPAAPPLPERLTSAEFWKLQADISEPGGYFRIADNFTSNEGEVGQVSTNMRALGLKGGVYIGVGPEQNFSYIAALRPQMAFIIDIRRQAVMQHLLFKAIFEMSADRADFVSLLFAKPRPDGLTRTTPIQQIWSAYLPVAADAAFAEKAYARIVERLAGTHGFVFTDDEKAQLEWVWSAFVGYGPGISTRGSMQAGGGGNNWTFADLTGWAVDASGEPQSFLSTDDNYQFVKSLHERNLLVPVSGDFGGSKALRAIGDYVRKQGGTVSAFYLSNVEQYLFQDQKSVAFYENVATLPIDDKTVFIRPYALRSGLRPLCPIGSFLESARAGRMVSNYAAMACGN